MQKGDLVRVRWRVSDDYGRLVADSPRNGIVVDYRPNTLGGTGIVTWRHRGGPGTPEVISTTRRGEVLIRMLDVDGMSWFDEADVQLLSQLEG